MAATAQVVSYAGLADPLDPELWGAEDSGYLGWSQDPEYVNNSATLTSHVRFLTGLRVRRGGSLGHVVIGKSGTAGTITDFRVGIYDANGVQVAKTANQSANVTGTNAIKRLAVASVVDLPPGKYFGEIWCIASVAPTLAASTATTPMSIASNDPTGSTAVRRFGSVTDGGSGTDVSASLTVGAGGNVTSPVYAVTSAQVQPWLGLTG